MGGNGNGPAYVRGFIGSVGHDIISKEIYIEIHIYEKDTHQIKIIFIIGV